MNGNEPCSNLYGIAVKFRESQIKTNGCGGIPICNFKQINFIAGAEFGLLHKEGPALVVMGVFLCVARGVYTAVV